VANLYERQCLDERIGSEVVCGLCHSVNCAGARYDPITLEFLSNTRVRSSSVDLGALIGRSVCQPISALAHSAFVVNRQDAIYRKGKQVSVRAIGSARPYHSTVPDQCGIHFGTSSSRHSNSIKSLLGSTLANLQPTRLVQSNASARQSASTRVRPISKAPESVRPQPARLFHQVRS
jgi:hypothetical protein